MTRSAEAIQARARKRNRSVAEQRRTDSLQQQPQPELMTPNKRHSRDTTTSLHPPTTTMTTNDKNLNDNGLSPIVINRHDHVADDDHDAADANNTPASSTLEPGAWTCPKCDNFNYASRRTCHSKTCDETRPAAATEAYYNNSNNSGTLHHQRRQPSFAKPRHDPATSKVVPWTAPPATKEQLEKNRELRQRYLDATAAGDKTTSTLPTTNKNTTLTLEEIERARILVARDERKELRRQEKRDRGQRWRDGSTKSDPALSTATGTATTIPAAKDKNRAQKLAGELRRERRRLRKLYLSTKGVGMEEDEIQRAKVLVARHEKKQQRQGKVQGVTTRDINVTKTTATSNDESN